LGLRRGGAGCGSAAGGSGAVGGVRGVSSGVASSGVFQDLAGGLGRVAQLGGGSVLVIGTCGVEVFLIIVQRVAARISWQGRQPFFQFG